MEKKLFGKLDTGAPVYSYTIENDKIFAEIITYGAAIKGFGFSDDKKTNFVGSFDSIDDYVSDTSHQGAIIGRIANRVENAKFVMDGKTYFLPKNDGENSLHGGNGFDRRIWEVTEYSDTTVTLSYTSADGEEGYPAALTVFVTYSVIDSTLLIDYKAIPEGKTPIALTNHAYFNIDGFGCDVLSQKIQIFADSYSEVNEALIPTGRHPDVSGTVFDLREPRRIGDAISESFSGYDHNYILSPDSYEIIGNKELGLAAIVYGKSVKLSTFTDMKNIQFYSANFLGGGPDFSGNIKQVRYGALCLEAQTEPNAVNSGIGFYGKGEIYTQSTAYRIERTEI